MPDYGRDLACIFDLDPLMREIEGTDRMVLVEAIVRRITTGEGLLIDDESYGKDVRRELSRDLDAAELAMLGLEYGTQIERDQRVLSAIVTATMATGGTAGTRTLRMSILVRDADGPFTLTLAVTALTVTILEAA
jgi:hypothetical protein